MVDLDPTKALWTDYVYDIETYLNCYSCEFTHVASGTRWVFEVSDRINQSTEFVLFMDWLASIGARMVGFNNEGFDYVVIHHLISIFRQRGSFDALDAYHKTKQVFAVDWNDRFSLIIPHYQRLVVQVDLMKIHHFEPGGAKTTSLKKLEIAMRSKSVKDLPFDPDLMLTFDQIGELISYMGHDVAETLKFYLHSLSQIKFRMELTEKYEKDFTNFNDTKIGKEYFKMELEKVLPGITGTYKKPNKTLRENIAVGEVILPYVQFTSPEFNRILTFFRQANIKTKTNGVGDFKGFFKGLECVVGGLKFVFGAGGIHASANGIFVADDEYDIIDVDVTSFYPDLAIQNKFFPQHLTEAFCAIYKQVFDMRMTYDKKTSESAMLKLALNGVYGESNAAHGVFLDPQYTMSITINGQLLIAMLSEWVMTLPGVSLIQANTDGISCRVHKSVREQFMAICRHWEGVTSLGLEDVDYSRMFVRDVNNYIGEYKKDGKLKRIGAYGHVTPLEDPFTREVQWHKDHSALVVPKAAEAALVRGEDPTAFIMAQTDPFDFMLSQKVPRSMELISPQYWVEESGKVWSKKDQVWVDKTWEVPAGMITKYQNTCRYYIARDGLEMYKHMPPLKNAPTKERYNSIEKGYLVKSCDDAGDFDWANMDVQYYIDEAHKLINAIT